MDITCPGLRDRRLAASDSRQHQRRNGTIQVIILHSTSGPFFVQPTVVPTARSRHGAARQRGVPIPYPTDPSTDSNVRSYHRLDQIAAHFVVIDDGTIFYTHDIEYLSRSAGGRFGIDIEFAGRFSSSRRLSATGVHAGRHLISALKQQVPTITHIHPHGQIQHELMETHQACGEDTGVRCGKLDSCPGPDIWINVGEWAATQFHLIAQTPLPNFQNNGISAAQRDRTFDQHIL